MNIACANPPSTGPGPCAERALSLGTSEGWELSGQVIGPPQEPGSRGAWRGGKGHNVGRKEECGARGPPSVPRCGWCGVRNCEPGPSPFSPGRRGAGDGRGLSSLAAVTRGRQSRPPRPCLASREPEHAEHACSGVSLGRPPTSSARTAPEGGARRAGAFGSGVPAGWGGVVLVASCTPGRGPDPRRGTAEGSGVQSGYRRSLSECGLQSLDPRPLQVILINLTPPWDERFL